MSSESHHITLRIPKHPMVLLIGLGTVGGVVWGIESFWPLVKEVMTAFNGLKGDPVKLSETFRNIIWGWSALGAAIIGLGGLALGFWRGMALHTQALAQKDQAASALLNSQTALKNAETTEKGQMAEAFAKAIEQLGHDEMSIRIGGILALEKISKTDPKGYHDQVFETLCAFVREKAGWTPEKEKSGKHRISQDIQFALSGICRRNYQCDDLCAPLNLSSTLLHGADLSHGHLAHTDLSHSDLAYSNLSESNLEGVNLTSSTLDDCECTGANFNNSICENVSFIRSRQFGSSFEDAFLMDSDFSYADLHYTDLSYAHLSGASFVDSYLGNSNFQEADISFANLKGARSAPSNIKQLAKWDLNTIWPEKFAEEEDTEIPF